MATRFSGPRREGGHGGRDGSVWSASALQAAKVIPPRLSIDWNAIRENKDKYEELKWKGEGIYLAIIAHKLIFTFSYMFRHI